MDIIARMQWRYATKKFSDRKLSLETLHTLLESANLTATSYGLQAYKIIVVDDPDIRQQLLPHTMGQRQVVEASHLLVLCSYIDVSSKEVDAFTSRVGKIKNKSAEAVAHYSQKILSKVNQNKASGKFESWLSKQIYIVLGNLMTTCAILGIDSCPMEGFESKKYDEILQLQSLNLKSIVLLPIGYRAADDKSQFSKKVRKDLEDLLVFM